jgi:hypothetical protein
LKIKDNKMRLPGLLTTTIHRPIRTFAPTVATISVATTIVVVAVLLIIIPSAITVWAATIYCRDQETVENRTCVGTHDTDTIFASDQTLIIYALGGNDIVHSDRQAASGLLVYGGDGQDSLYGTWRDDVLRGDAGNDYIVGYYGNDRLHGGPGNDQLRGFDNNDVLFGGYGDDNMAGGNGADTYYCRPGIDAIFFNIHQGDIIGDDTCEIINPWGFWVFGGFS